jgi:hypothetical protein
MFSVSAISNISLNRILLNKRGSSSTEDGNTSARISYLAASDIITLSSESLALLEDMINSTGDGSSSTRFSNDSPDILDAIYNSASEETELSVATNESLDLLNVLINSTANAPDTSAGSLYDILLSARNERLIENNPDLVNMILAAEETDSSDSSSWIPATEDINLVSMSANEILNMIKKYRSYSGPLTDRTSILNIAA